MIYRQKKVFEATKEKKDVVLNWSHLNLCRHSFDFNLSNTAVVVDLFVLVFALLLLLLFVKTYKGSTQF